MQVLVPQPRTEPAHLVVEARSLQHWTTREVLPVFLNLTFITYYRVRQKFSSTFLGSLASLEIKLTKTD